MRKMKLCVVSALVIGVMALGTGCASKDASKPAETTAAPTAETTAAPTQAETTEADSQMETAAMKDQSSQMAGDSQKKEDKEFTGTFEENKGFMFLVKSDKDGDDYAFNLSDDTLVKGINAGDKVVVTYQGEDPSSTDATDTTVVKVTKAK